jgi:hypothetical protein
MISTPPSGLFFHRAKGAGVEQWPALPRHSEQYHLSGPFLFPISLSRMTPGLTLCERCQGERLKIDPTQSLQKQFSCLLNKLLIFNAFRKTKGLEGAFF